MEEPTHMRQQVIRDFWLRLDNAAKMYPAILNKEFTTVFRLSAVLKQPVQIRPFLRAVAQVEQRFPYYKMRLRRGFFWYYLEHNSIPVHVQPDHGALCRGFQKFGDHGLLFRILVRGGTISVEFSHILTDGKGALEFLKSLLVTYFSQTGISIPASLGYLQPETPISGQELEDSFQRYFQKDLPDMGPMSRAFHLPLKLPRPATFNVMTVSLPMDKIKEQAGHRRVSITEYLISAYLCALQRVYQNLDRPHQRRQNKVLRIQVPVDLRRIFPSLSMRNFTLFVLPEIDLRLGYYYFDEIVKKVHHQMELEKDKKVISQTISRNVGSEKDQVLRSVPLFIKRLILQTQYYSRGANLYSGELTNLGKIDLTRPLNDWIEAFAFIPPPPNRALKVDCGVIGFRDQLMLSFANITRSQSLETAFLNVLNQDGIPFEIRNIF